MPAQQTMEEKYHQVTALYDAADELIATVDQSHRANREAHFSIVNPLVEQLEESTDALTEEFIKIAELGGKNVPTANKNRIEAAFRKFYAAFSSCQQALDTNKKQQTVGAIAGIVEPVMEKVKRQVEKVIAVFVEFVELSLDRIMQKQDLEQLKKHEAKVASMLHSQSQSTGKIT